MSRIVSFRGQLADLAQETINLETIRGQKGYKIIKFELMPANPGGQDSVNIVKLYLTEQTTIDALVDFSDPRLLAAGVVQNTASYAYGEYNVITFDNIIFNQDIYISNKDYAVGEAINYHIELEQMDLNMDEATVATLKNIRNND